MDKVGELSRGQVTRGLECQMIQRGKGCGPSCVLEFIPSSNTNLLSTYYVKKQTPCLYFMIPKDTIGDAASEAGWPVGRPVHHCRQKRIRLGGDVEHISPESQL